MVSALLVGWIDTRVAWRCNLAHSSKLARAFFKCPHTIYNSGGQIGRYNKIPTSFRKKYEYLRWDPLSSIRLSLRSQCPGYQRQEKHSGLEIEIVKWFHPLGIEGSLTLRFLSWSSADPQTTLWEASSVRWDRKWPIYQHHNWKDLPLMMAEAA